ncbi:hypothetical protein ACHAW5_007073 [Stephanodiscus triporus]|uniref:Uncharacterized protein n=1 Tax=Stephanodiscus triporus TaxID=2934178 RepID=A0ABD3PN04_9STRA
MLIGGPPEPGPVVVDDDDVVEGKGEVVATYFGGDGKSVPNDVVRLRVDPSVDVIPPEAFRGRTSIVQIELHEGLREIGERAFADCSSLVGPLKVPSSVKIIHEGAFARCTSLTEVILRNGLEEIRNHAFSRCTALKRVRTMIKIVLKEERTPTKEERLKLGLHNPEVKFTRRYEYDIDLEMSLKPVFVAFSNERGVSMRSLRLSYKGERIFMSDVKNKTPKALCMKELSMNDEDVITVVVESDETNLGNANAIQRQQTQRVNKIKKKKIKGAMNNKSNVNKKEQVKQYNPAMTVEDYKRQHSMILSKLHDEVQPRLKDIRMKLNALDLERQPPKSKNQGHKKGTKEEPDDQMLLPDSGVGGKAGKAYFVVQVGEVQNLYKTTKTSAHTSLQQGQSEIPTLDLHGCTRVEAIAKLNESLKVWVDTAMRGYDPFVITAVIVCGCGSQVLSETVQEWIKSTGQNRVLTWIYTFHERSFEKASEALEAIETNDNVEKPREEAIESVKRYVTAMKEGDFLDIVQIVFEENNNAADDLRPSKKSRKSSSDYSYERDWTTKCYYPILALAARRGEGLFLWYRLGKCKICTRRPKCPLTSLQQGQSEIPTLDLHGCTRVEAIAKLNESLEVWVDTAMRGYDPIVITAVIVCGCGSQVLSETVQEWIKSNSKVRNAPNNHLL